MFTLRRGGWTCGLRFVLGLVYLALALLGVPYALALGLTVSLGEPFANGRFVIRLVVIAADNDQSDASE